MSTLPSVVRKQVEAADKVAKEYYESLKTPAGTPPAGDPNAAAVASAESSDAAAKVAAASAAAAAAATATTPPTEEGWEKKYRVLQGKYNAEVPRLTQRDRERETQVRDLQAQLTTTQNLLASLGAQRGTAPAGNEPAPPAQSARLVKDEEVKEFGADLYDFIKRTAREEQAALLPEIDRRVAPVAQRVDAATKAVAGVGAKVAANDQQSVMQMLAEQVPDWAKLNEDPGFLEWLDQRDPFSMQVRGLMLKQAFENHDGPRVVNFFRGYQKEHAAVTSPANPAAPTVATPPAGAPQRSLEQLVAPGTPKPGAASTPNGSGKRDWTRSEIGQYYADVAAGRYRSRADEARKIEADIFLAQREGRIRS